MKVIKKIIPKFIKSFIRQKKKKKLFFWGSFKKTEPVDRFFGYSRGTPIDRYYIDRFLESNKDSITGNVLEISEDTYTKKFGSFVQESVVLHVKPEKVSTYNYLYGDLETGDGIPKDKFDCMILTQTLPFIFDIQSTLRNCHKSLKKNGVLLASVSSISQISRYDMDNWGDYWRFTPLSVKLSFEKIFDKNKINIFEYGNVLTATSLLQGISTEELSKLELDYSDQDYPVTIGVKAIK